MSFGSDKDIILYITDRLPTTTKYKQVALRGKEVRAKAKEVRGSRKKAGLMVKMERMGGCGGCVGCPETFPLADGPSRRREPWSMAAKLGLHDE